MPTIEELHDADKQHAAAIAELRGKIDTNTQAIARHQEHLLRLDEVTMAMRESIARVATKDDVNELRNDINKQFVTQLTAAHNSIPSKFAAIFAGGMFVIAVVTLFVSLVKHG